MSSRLIAIVIFSVMAVSVGGLFLLKNLETNTPLPDKSNITVAQTIPVDLDISICTPSNEEFSTVIDNPYFPLTVGQKSVIEEPEGFRVEITVLDDTEVVAGVETRVVEEREWENGELIEVSRNFFVQAPDNTVCYFGEDVDMYSNGEITSHDGAWRAGVGENQPGIMMPGNVIVGQSYQQEIAPGVAMDRATHDSFEESYTTPAGTFEHVLLVEEIPSSTKRYAPGVGLVFDDGAVLTSY